MAELIYYGGTTVSLSSCYKKIESLGGPSLLFKVKSNKKYRLIQKYITKGLLLCVVVLWLRCWSSVMVSLCELQRIGNRVLVLITKERRCWLLVASYVEKCIRSILKFVLLYQPMHVLVLIVEVVRTQTLQKIGLSKFTICTIN